MAWLDTGTAGSLLEASNLVESLENRQDSQIACLEQIALNNGWLTVGHLRVYRAP